MEAFVQRFTWAYKYGLEAASVIRLIYPSTQDFPYYGRTRIFYILPPVRP